MVRKIKTFITRVKEGEEKTALLAESESREPLWETTRTLLEKKTLTKDTLNHKNMLESRGRQLVTQSRRPIPKSLNEGVDNRRKRGSRTTGPRNPSAEGETAKATGFKGRNAKPFSEKAKEFVRSFILVGEGFHFYRQTRLI